MRVLTYHFLVAILVVLLFDSVSYGQDVPGSNVEHLKPFGPMIGVWRYEGPLLEDVPEIAKKGSPFVAQLSWRRILDKSVVEEAWSVEYEDGTKVSGKSLIGWNAAEKQLVSGGMNSLGGMSLGNVVFDADAKSSTLTAEGIEGDGKKTSFKGVVIVKDKSAITWQALEHTGGDLEGPSPVYTFKRVRKPKGSKPVK